MEIKSKERIKKYGEVFTPVWVVKKMLDCLLEENPDAFLPDKTFLEPTCGEGVFILEILKRKFEYCKTKKDYITAIDSIYGFEIQADNVEICINNVINLCREYFNTTKKDIELIKDHIIQCDALKIMKLLSKFNATESERENGRNQSS